MTRAIVVSSGKGGVGKTTLVSNLSATLADYGKSVVALDANLPNSNLGLHLGMHLYPKTIHDVLEGRARLEDVSYPHKSGFKVIPADISLRKIRDVKSHDFVDIFYKLLNEHDFVIIDSPPGMGVQSVAAIEAADEMLLVTNPDLPAVTDALKMKIVADKHSTHNLGVVVNRVKNESHELPNEHIEKMLDLPVIGTIPEDREVSKAIAVKEPVAHYNPSSMASQHIKSVAASLIGETYEPKIPLSLKLFGWLRR